MKKYVIERDIPGVGKMSPAELRTMSEKSNAILRELGPGIQWVQSYVAGDKMYCIYYAANPDLILEHARCGGFPATRISELAAIIDPTTGEP
jgi:Nickel responsive protein SCO4226-like